MFKYCSTFEPMSLSAKICNDADLAPSLSLSESSGTNLDTHSQNDHIPYI